MTTYDEVPYSALAFAASHPDRLATVAILAGFDAPDIESSRVLELGCGRGGNLLPMAALLPGAEFVGIDLSPRQIEDGVAQIESLGIRNTRLECRDIADLDVAGEPFDYIICHGVFSWVPGEVQDRILELCRSSLTPNGLAYISYNVLPGWHLHRGLRELLYDLTSDAADARERLEHARSLIAELSTELPQIGTPYAKVTAALAEWLGTQDDTYLLHEYLEENNRPTYFRDFVARAATHGLEYVGDATSGEQRSKAERLAERLVLELVGGGDPIELEQYKDMLFGAQFRRSVLRRAGTAPHSNGLDKLRAAARLRCTSETPAPTKKEAEHFETVEGVRATTNDPLLKTAFLLIAEQWPRSVPFDRLVEEAGRRLGVTMDEGSRDRLGNAMRQANSSGLVSLHTWEPPIASRPGTNPVAPLYARLQAAAGQRRVVNARHFVVDLEPRECAILRRLDGTNDVQAVTEALMLDAKSAGLEHGLDTKAQYQSTKRLRDVIEQEVETALHKFAMTALLLEQGE